jgi:hypothetical protein
MLIGIVSDSHGHDQRLGRALEQLRQRGAETVVHCGDIDSPEAVARLGGCGMEAYLVAGNVDRRHIEELAEAAEEAGVEFSEESLHIDLEDGERLALTHGHLDTLLEGLVRGGQFRYVCHGHSHRRRDERFGSTRVINPGSLHKPKSGHEYTVALLDTRTDQLEWLTVKKH